MKQFFIVRGLPGSGKTTLAKALTANFVNSSCHVEADMYFMKDGEYKWTPHEIHKAHQWCQATVESALNDPNIDVVVVSNTFTTKKEMQPYFDMARKIGLEPHVVLCQNRWSNTHNVPSHTLLKMSERFEFEI